MTNILRVLVVALACIFALSGCDRNEGAPASGAARTQNKDAVLRIAAVSGQIAQQVIAEFSKRADTAAALQLFDSAAELEARVLAGGSGFDVVVLQGSFIERQTNAGVFVTLDKEQLPSLRGIDAGLLQHAAEHDPDNRQSVPYLVRGVRLGYSEQRVRALRPDAPLDSWSVLLDPESAAALQSCGVGMLDSPTVVLKVLLASMARDPRQPSRDDLNAASANLLALRPFIRTIGSPAQIADGLARGDLCIAMTSGTETRARTSIAQAPNYSVPKEGTVWSFDMLAIPADTKSPRNAHALVDFLLDRSSATFAASVTNPAAAAAEGAEAVPIIPATSFPPDIEREVLAAWRAFAASSPDAER